MSQKGDMGHVAVTVLSYMLRGMAVLAVQAIRRMRGGAQSQMMLGADGRLWVVKFRNNPRESGCWRPNLSRPGWRSWWV